MFCFCELNIIFMLLQIFLWQLIGMQGWAAEERIQFDWRLQERRKHFTGCSVGLQECRAHSSARLQEKEPLLQPSNVSNAVLPQSCRNLRSKQGCSSMPCNLGWSTVAIQLQSIWNPAAVQLEPSRGPSQPSHTSAATQPRSTATQPWSTRNPAAVHPQPSRSPPATQPRSSTTQS